jgi:hypothetical protein
MQLLRAPSLLVFLCGMAAAQNAVPSLPLPSTKPETYRISGVVVSAVDNQPLTDVEVTIGATERREDTREVVTASDGRFVFQNVPPGKYNLTGMRRGFSTQAYQQHDQYSTAIAVGPGLASEDLIFRLTPDASIAGNVLDEENEPVRSGEAMLFSRNGETGGIRLVVRNGLDEQGHFRFSHLKAGTYYVAITRGTRAAGACRSVRFIDGDVGRRKLRHPRKRLARHFQNDSARDGSSLVRCRVPGHLLSERNRCRECGTNSASPGRARQRGCYRPRRPGDQSADY